MLHIQTCTVTYQNDTKSDKTSCNEGVFGVFESKSCYNVCETLQDEVCLNRQGLGGESRLSEKSSETIEFEV